MNKFYIQCKHTFGLDFKCFLWRMLIIGAWSGCAFGQSLSSTLSQFIEVQLSSYDMGRLELQTGWPKDDAQTFLVRIKNTLKFPINCKGLSVTFQNSSSPTPASLVPKLYIASSQIKQGSIKNLSKDKVKSYVLICTCYKKQGSDVCQNPLAKEN
jgi:hypothetical protein